MIRNSSLSESNKKSNKQTGTEQVKHYVADQYQNTNSKENISTFESYYQHIRRTFHCALSENRKVITITVSRK